MRLIDADILEKQIVATAHLGGPITKLVGAITMIIDLQPTAMQWIPVSERLPDVGAQALVTTGEGDVDCDSVVQGSQWFWGQGHYDVIAWMPLPEPYKGG